MKENRIVTISIVFTALVVLAIVLRNFQQVMRPMAIAIPLFFMVTPLARLSKQKKIPVWITFSGLFLGIFLKLSQISSLVSVENLDLRNAIPVIGSLIAVVIIVVLFGVSFGLSAATGMAVFVINGGPGSVRQYPGTQNHRRLAGNVADSDHCQPLCVGMDLGNDRHACCCLFR